MDRMMMPQDDARPMAGRMKDRDILRQYIRKLEKGQLIDLFIRQLRGPEEIKIPLSIFNRRLSSLEAIVKYLREELDYSNKKIALSLKRSPQNIWITYRNAKKKQPERLVVRESKHDMPIDSFDDKLSILESIVMILKRNFSDKEIAEIIKRDRKTVATVNFRVKKKSAAGQNINSTSH